MNNTNQTVIVNNVPIILANFNNEKHVPIRPICKAIGVNYRGQFEKIKDDEILNAVISLRDVAGADGKEYKMRVIPLRYVFGWLFTINPNNVNPEISKNIVAYRMECYNALFDILQNEMY